jgi:DNA excision repair protein ERCC-2
MALYSPSLSTRRLEFLESRAGSLPDRFARAFRSCSAEARALILHLARESAPEPRRIWPELDSFERLHEEAQALLNRYLESDLEVEADDPVLGLAYAWGDFTDALLFVEQERAAGRGEEFFCLAVREEEGSHASLHLVCSDASRHIAPAYERFEHTIAFSATLQPFSHSIRLSGQAEQAPETLALPSPFPRQNRKVMIIPQVSTRLKDRARSTPRVAEILERVIALRPGNYFAFFPSFAWMEKVVESVQLPHGFRSLIQPREAKPQQVEAFLETLREPSKPTLAFGVQGGIFSEGVDYPGDLLIGAFIVGPPLPRFDAEQEGKREYYQKKFGRGFDAAYTWPAMTRAVQAAGRVIRTETDRGVILLIDDRFLEPAYAECLPRDWYAETPRELVPRSILSELKAFWENAHPSPTESQPKPNIQEPGSPAIVEACPGSEPLSLP